MSQIIEIGFEIEDEEQYRKFEIILQLINEGLDIAYYVEPPRNPPFISLADLECQCEGK